VDVCETNNDLHVQVEMPGVQERQLRIEFFEGVLTIRAERPPDPALRRDQVQPVESQPRRVPIDAA